MNQNTWHQKIDEKGSKGSKCLKRKKYTICRFNTDSIGY